MKAKAKRDRRLALVPSQRERARLLDFAQGVLDLYLGASDIDRRPPERAPALVMMRQRDGGAA